MKPLRNSTPATNCKHTQTKQKTKNKKKKKEKKDKYTREIKAAIASKASSYIKSTMR
jgi:hypothetical protein